MKFLKKLRSSNFWVSMISAVVLILQAVFDVTIKAEYLNQIIMAILGLLVMSGIISDGSSAEMTVTQSVDMESIKTDLTEMLTQTTASIESAVLNIANQFQSIKDDGVQTLNEVINAQTTAQLSNAISNEVMAAAASNEQTAENAQNQTSDTQNNIQNVEVKVEDVNVQNVNASATSTQQNFDTL